MKKLLMAVTLAGARLTAQPAPGNETISAHELRADLYFLASDEMRGRLSETPENRIAAGYIRSRFERLGLEGLGVDGSFAQAFHLMRAALGEANELELESDRGSTMRGASGQS